jgi:hypothetical protein
LYYTVTNTAFVNKNTEITALAFISPEKMADHASPARQTDTTSRLRNSNIFHALKNNGIQQYPASPTPTDATDHSLWKATHKIKILNNIYHP